MEKRTDKSYDNGSKAETLDLKKLCSKYETRLNFAFRTLKSYAYETKTEEYDNGILAQSCVDILDDFIKRQKEKGIANERNERSN